MSKLLCMLNQNSGVVPRALDSRRDVSGVTAVCSFTSRSMRVRGTPIALARLADIIPSGLQKFMLEDFVRMAGGVHNSHEHFFSVFDSGEVKNPDLSSLRRGKGMFDPTTFKIVFIEDNLSNSVGRSIEPRQIVVV